MKKKGLIVGVIVLLLLIQPTLAANVNIVKKETSINESLKIIPKEISLDKSFIVDIVQKLSNVTFKNEKWLGREYGTPGEQYAAKFLENVWNKSNFF